MKRRNFLKALCVLPAGGVLVNGTVSSELKRQVATRVFLVKKGDAWRFVTHGIWNGTLCIERRYDEVGPRWEYVLPPFHYPEDINVHINGREQNADARYRVYMLKMRSGANLCKYTFEVPVEKHA